MAAADDFRRGLVQLGKEMVTEGLADLMADTARQALRGVVGRSPVDTGRFRGNWQVVSDPAAAKPSATVDKEGSATIAAGDAAIAAAVAADPHGRICIANPLRYAGLIEYGSSKQAPLGVVEITAAEVELIRYMKEGG